MSPWKSVLGWIFLLLIIMGTVACVPQKKLRYLQENQQSASVVSTAPAVPQHKLVPFDLLHVQIFSASPELLNTPGFEVSTNFGTTASIYLQGYQVAPNGVLELPLLGDFLVSGMTVPELQEALTRSAREKISLDADAVVKLVNFKISVLGEVNVPGVIQVYESRISILETLAFSGDLTPYGDRKKVMLIRETDGKSEVYTIDLTDRNLLYSPYYYLRSNDVLYIPSLDAKSYGFSQVQWNVIFSSLSTVITILAILYKK